MFHSNSITNDKPVSIDSDKKEKMTLEVEKDDLDRFISQCKERVYKCGEFFELVENINSADWFKQTSGLIGIRKLLDPNLGEESQIQKAIDAGLIPKFVEFMKNDDQPKLQLEAIWALNRMTSGTSDQVGEIIDQGAASMLVELLKSDQIQLIEKAVWAIGNIAADTSDHRDILLDYGALHPLIDVLKEALVSKKEELMKDATWALANLCRGKPLPSYERVADATPVFCTVIQEITDTEVLRDALWSLSYLSNREEKVARLLQSDIIAPLVKYLDCSDIAVGIPTLRTLGNIVAGSDEQADVLLKGPLARSYMKKLFKLLKQKCDHLGTRREVCWVLSNITCRSSDYVELILGKTEYIEQLINIANYDVLEVQREAVWVLSNATVKANAKQMVSMGRNGVFDCLCKLFQQDLFDRFDLVLLGIISLLTFEGLMSRKQATNNKHLIKLKQKDVINKIKKSRGSPNQQMSERAMKIWSRYLKGNLLRKNLRLERAIICFRNERHSVFGLSQNKKKKLGV